MVWPPRRLTGRGAVEQGQCFHHCRSFFHSPCRRWTALFCPLLLFHRPNPSYPFLFTLFCPQRIHCRRVVGGYRQPVGISVSTRARVWGMDEFCKSPFFFFRPLPVVPLAFLSASQPVASRPMARCMRRAFKRQKRSSLLQLLFGRAARLCVRFRWMTRTSESAME